MNGLGQGMVQVIFRKLCICILLMVLPMAALAHHDNPELIKDSLGEMNVALLVPGKTSDNFWSRVVKDAKIAANDLNVNLSVFNSQDFAEMERNAQFIVDSGFDAAIFPPIWKESEEVLAILNEGQVSTITINSRFRNENLKPRVDYQYWLGGIYPDELQSSRVLSSKLIGQAGEVSRVLAIAGGRKSLVSNKRLQGLKLALDEAGFEGELDIVYTNWSVSDAELKIDKNMDLSRPYSLVWGVTGELAIAGKNRFGKQHDDIPVGGFNWGEIEIEGIRSGDLSTSMGGHYLDAVFALSMLVDYKHHIDFGSQKFEFDSFMLGLDFANLERFEPLIYVDENVDFSVLSLTFNPNRFRFDFDLETALAIIEAPKQLQRMELDTGLKHWLGQHSKIRFGSDASFAPYEYIENGAHAGLMSSYLAEISSLTGLKFELDYAGSSFTEIEQLLVDKAIDMVPVMAPSKARSEHILFTNPIFSESFVLFGKSSLGPVDGVQFFRGKKVATVEGYHSTDLMAENYPSIISVQYSNSALAFQALQQGEVDAVVGLMTSGMYIVNKENLHDISALTPTGDTISLSIAVRKDWPELVEIINQALLLIDEPTKKAIYDYWILLKYEVGINKQQVYRWIGYPLVFLIAWLFITYLSKRRLVGQLAENQRLSDKFRALFDSSSELIFVVDSFGKINDCNNSAIERLSFNSKEELINKSPLDISPTRQQDNQSSRTLHLEHLAQLQKSNEQVFEWTLISRKTGELIHTEMTLKRIDVNDEPMILATAHDVSDRLLLQNKIEQERDQLRKIMGQSPVGVLLLDGDVTFYANEQMQEFIHLDPDDSMEKLFVERSQYRSFLETSQNEDSGFALQAKWWSRNGAELEILMSCYHIEIQGKDNLLCWAMDITESEHFQKQLIEAKELAEQAGLAKANFLANMSHEIRTPMNAILGMSYLALEYAKDPVLKRYIDNVHTSAGNLMGIINDILDFSKVDAGKLILDVTEFDLNSLVKDCCGIVSVNSEPKDIELVVDIPQLLPALWYGDPLRLKQILLNLLNNAVKFTGEGGAVVMTIQMSKISDTEYSLYFEVSDTGIGMPQEVIDKLFTPFSQGDSSTSRKYGGTGLGLTISQNLVELMGGEIQVNSTVNTGSQFSFEIVLEAVETHDEPKILQQFKSEKVIFIGPENISSHALGKMLNSFELDFKRFTSFDDSVRSTLLMPPVAGSDIGYSVICLGISNDELIQEIKLHQSEAKSIDDQAVKWILLLKQYDDSTLLQKMPNIQIIYKPATPSTLHDALLAKYASTNDDSSPVTSGKPQIYRGIKALLAEDNSMNQELIKGILEPYGLEIDVAENGAICLEMLAETQYDIVLMDCQMPIMDGYEATRNIRLVEHYQHIPIVALTANALEGDRDKVLDAGMNDYITKPINIADMVKTLNMWLFDQEDVSVPLQPISAPTAIKNVAIFDSSSGLANCDNNSELYLRLLRTFAKTSVDFIQQLNSDLTRLDRGNSELKNIERQAHTLKSTSSSIGGLRVAVLAEKLENGLAGAGDTISHVIDELVPEIDDALIQTIEAVNQYVRKISGSHEDGRSKDGELNHQDMEMRVADLKKALMENDAESLEIAAHLSATDLFSSPKGKKVIDLIELYEFDDALETLNIMLESEKSRGKG